MTTSLKTLTGIGSRETPLHIIGQIQTIVSVATQREWTLYSGGADGADLAFETAYREAKGRHMIFLPWKGFNKNPSPYYEPPAEAYEIAERIHPAWGNCSRGAQRLHARNIQQILGLDLKTPTDMVFCWTKNGEEIGGTRTAIVLAKERNIPVYNLFFEDQYYTGLGEL